MAKTLIDCPECGAEMLVECPGRKVAAAYVEIGYSNGGAVVKLQQAIELVNAAAADLPFRDDLALVARLLMRVDAELVAVDDEES